MPSTCMYFPTFNSKHFDEVTQSKLLCNRYQLILKKYTKKILPCLTQLLDEALCDRH